MNDPDHVWRKTEKKLIYKGKIGSKFSMRQYLISLSDESEFSGM